MIEVRSEVVRDTLYRTWSRVNRLGRDTATDSDESPLRSELFSADQMELHGKVLAGMHRLADGRARERLLARLSENEALLLDVHDLLTEDVQSDRRITPGRRMAARQLLRDRGADPDRPSRHLPKGYSRELPSLAATAPSAGLPSRVRHRPGDHLARRRTG
jgi:cyclic beta-1,2-glucan synthetase